MCGCTWSGSLSGHLSNMLNARQLDLAVLFDTQPARRWSVLPLLEERLFLIRSRPARRCAAPCAARLPKRLAPGAAGQHEPLILPTGPHGLRSRHGCGLCPGARGDTRRWPWRLTRWRMLMDAVDMGLGSTIQPWAAVGRYAGCRQSALCLAETCGRRPPFGLRRCAACRTMNSRPLRWPRVWCWATACVSWCSRAGGSAQGLSDASSDMPPIPRRSGVTRRSQGTPRWRRVTLR